MKRVTIKDIAQIAGVSCATISRALNDSPEVSPETRERIREICRREGYQANSLARSLVSNHTGIIGLILPNISSPFYSEVALNVEICARKLGYSVMMCNSFHNPEQVVDLIQFLISLQVDGILIADSRDGTYQYITTHPPVTPVVLLGEFSSPDSASACNVVSLDNFAAGRLATEYLIGLGHRDIAYLGSQTNSTSHLRRCSGYTQAMEDHCLTARVMGSSTADSPLEQGAEMTKAFFASGQTCTAIFAATDTLAMGVMQAARELGLQIPQDLSLVGTDNCTFSGLPGTMLTTVDQRKAEIARTAVELLDDLIRREAPTEDYTHRILRPVLVPRSTCAQFPKREA